MSAEIAANAACRASLSDIVMMDLI